MTKRKTVSAWESLIDQGEIGPQPYRRAISAGDADCRAIAKLLDLPAVDSLSADYVLQRAPSNKAVIHVQGMIKANVVQSCVVTQAPVKSHIEDEFEAWYADPSSFLSFAKAKSERTVKGPEGGEVQVMDEREDPEPMLNGKIDLGDLAVQYLSLGLPSYPRAHGVAWDNSDDPEAAPPPSEARPNPFAALKDWKAGK